MISELEARFQATVPTRAPAPLSPEWYRFRAEATGRDVPAAYEVAVRKLKAENVRLRHELSRAGLVLDRLTGGAPPPAGRPFVEGG